MRKLNWIHKIKITTGHYTQTKLLSENAFGIYFEFLNDATITVSFKPLNDVFPEDISESSSGVLLNFERELIEEDDIEYALEIMLLFNTSKRIRIEDANQSAKIKSVIDLITDEFLSEKASYIVLKTVLKVLMLHLIRFQNNTFIDQDLNQKRVFQFLKLMETSFLKETKADYYANEMGISEKRLNQILKEKLNVTAKQIIQQRQITEAKRRLVKSEITIKELAYVLGFDSMSSFSRFFKKFVQVNPSTYRLEHT
ncbi:helix-turn-helix domain-containing protein [Formosa algae]|uniref:AraC-like DNA-binding protein n=1 Tax=Formosa algae TaxID=225843 RepID=A0A9X1C9P2_9FLAO|nr:helix-turn-helix domain-containing protein [Formosa algae]MBP1841486.1 AraC-like DNA-binding protein [Formosa algae]MDQ0336592.1 AraC-like DNA-binding protein [Formosa algae]OEI81944.1 AraC family transcriptional regulator [Formosa algae]